MAPAPIDPTIQDVVVPKKDTLGLPDPALKRLTKAGIDLSNGYPYRPSKPLYLDDVYNIRNKERLHADPGSRADKSKSALFSAATKVTDLTTHIGTEIEGLQLKDLTDQQKDELGLLIAERSVVFFRDQDISPQQQKDLGEWYGEIEIHVKKAPVGVISGSVGCAKSLNSPKFRKCQASLESPSSGLLCKPLRIQQASASREVRLVGIPTWCTKSNLLA